MPYRRTERVIERLAARRDDIVAAARLIAARDGLGAVQIAPVAEHAGIAAGTVYRYFPAKTDLVAALLEEVAGEEIAAIERAAAAAPGPLSALAAAITAFACRAVRRRRLVFAALAEPLEPELETLGRLQRRAIVAAFERCLQIAGGAAGIPEQNYRNAAVALVAAIIEGLIGPLADEGGGEAGNQKDAIQEMVLFLLRALGVPDARARGLVVQVPWPTLDAP